MMIGKMLVWGVILGSMSMRPLRGAEEGEFPFAVPESAPETSGGGGGDTPAMPTASSSGEAPESWRATPPASRVQNPFRGNWFKKRILVQEARSTYDAIHTLVVDIWEPSFQRFLASYQPALDMMQRRIATLGFDRARIEVVALEALQERGAPASSDPLSELPDEIAHLLRETREAYDIIHDLQENVGQAIAIVQQQQPLGDQYEKQAWKQYEAIDAAYDDLEATQLYDAMVAAREHLEKLVGEYLQRQLVPYTQQLLQQFTTTMERLEQCKESLKKFDIYVVASERPVPPVPAAAPVPQGWLMWIGALIKVPFISLWELLKALWTWLLSWIR